MSIHSIRIKNLLSFNDSIIDDIKDVNCIVGKNNVGKSNLLKLIRYFYLKLEGKRQIPPELCSRYSGHGEITIRYNTTRIKSIVTAG
ncbi:AAA family ATPase [Ferrimonas sp.]|uniref:AAA family ATPase n=1 Tax=Ferrimonas sp. TaxID=2080861 RepID=UPI003A918770